MADTLNTGREIFRLRGCMGCHRYEGFDREADEMSSVNQQIRAAGAAEGRVDARGGLQHTEGRQDRATTPKRRSSTRTPTI